MTTYVYVLRLGPVRDVTDAELLHHRAVLFLRVEPRYDLVHESHHSEIGEKINCEYHCSMFISFF